MSMNCSVESRYCHGVNPAPPDLSTLIPCRPDMSTRLCPSDIKNFCVRNYYNMAKGGVYSRYTEGDWDTSNKNYFYLADKERSSAERLRADTWQLVVGAEDRTRNRQANNTKKLGDRTHDISFWKGELLAEINRMETEQVNLQEHRRVVEKALADTQVPLALSEESLLQREKRTGIDQVHDEVERLLSKEILTIKKCQDVMKKMIERMKIQQQLNRAALHLCDQDVQDKHHAQGLDDRAHQLRNSSYGIGLQHGIETIDNTISDQESWLRATKDNIERCQRERECSERVRGKVEGYLRACANEMCAAFNAVNVALAAKISETTALKDKLQEHLQKINNEIRDMDRNIALLRKAIVDKERYLKVVHSRLNQLNLRRNMELCHDDPMRGLICEVGEIRHTIVILKDSLQEAECAMCRLIKTRSILQNQIAVKENSLQVDARCLVGRRRSMAMDPDIGPLFNLDPCNQQRC